MKLVYLRGKKPVILKECGYHRQYEDYYRRLVRFDGVEWLSNGKVLGTIGDDGLFEPRFPTGITPEYIADVAKSFGLKIRMDNGIGGGSGSMLYYFDGLLRRADVLWKPV